ncbi:aminoglycoside 3'-phosphotransferase [Pseudomonas aeruginosa]|uniref:APH(3') family aminoglycoside O-phosphotransferase n=1 Tax=Pseudomonas aeruginosa TaxID=287 RepID=UPI00249A3044|nr:APH(3') family aminoglycoside O-phosphotransferase [Pseudomonas aeruginosa]EIW4154163.1 aminoglycoside 3'-phosphotransferase [Pseudomonas aeruginosa]EIW4158215.1 aminoglycoside 3'-phosphotransferase [Pseudomonas aeruginosa]WGX48640.1 aminoglycoside 3'-phosphotransferase [Pseudomonas aeruginosa]
MPDYQDDQPYLVNLFSPLLDGCIFKSVNHGESDARVVRITRPGLTSAFLKYAFDAAGDEIRDENERLSWLGKRAPVPSIIAYISNSDGAFLLSQALPGCNALDAAATNPASIVAEMARALRNLHSLPPRDCPFNQCLDVRIRLAQSRMNAGLVDEGDFDEIRKGATSRDLFAQLLTETPTTENLVVTHGDACPENFIIFNGKLVGFIDCGRLGLADKYQDLALASRNIESALGRHYSDLFLSQYGEPNPDLNKLKYYRLLDEFF